MCIFQLFRILWFREETPSSGVWCLSGRYTLERHSQLQSANITDKPTSRSDSGERRADSKYFAKENKGIHYRVAKGKDGPNYCFSTCKWFYKQSAPGNFISSSTVHNMTVKKSKFDEINLSITGRIQRAQKGIHLINKIYFRREYYGNHYLLMQTSLGFAGFKCTFSPN